MDISSLDISFKRNDMLNDYRVRIEAKYTKEGSDVVKVIYGKSLYDALTQLPDARFQEILHLGD